MKRRKPLWLVRASLSSTLRNTPRRDNSDVQGSYTGTPKDGGEPVQDADDL